MNSKYIMNAVFNQKGGVTSRTAVREVKTVNKSKIKLLEPVGSINLLRWV